MLQAHFYFGLLAIAYTLSGCQQSRPSASGSVPETQAAPATPGAPTQTAARTAVARYVQQQANAALFQLDSARFMDLDTHWQVLVPRTDWAGRMPNAAAFEVDKQTGRVTTRAVK